MIPKKAQPWLCAGQGKFCHCLMCTFLTKNNQKLTQNQKKFFFQVMIHVRPFPLRAGRGTFIDHQRNFLVQTEGPWRSLVLCFKSATDTFAPAQHFRVCEDAAGAWCNDASHHLLTVSVKLTQYFLRGVIWQQTGFLVLLDITVWSCAFGCVWIRTSEYLNRYKGVALGDGLLCYQLWCIKY